MAVKYANVVEMTTASNVKNHQIPVRGIITITSIKKKRKEQNFFFNLLN